jgi:hypothetical protein
MGSPRFDTLSARTTGAEKERGSMRRIWPIVFSLLIPVAFSGGYLLATDSAWTACVLQVPEGPHGVPSVCADISSTGVATGLGFGIVGVVVWAVAWAVASFMSSRRGAS